ncbi:MAG: hypothetical protein JNL82_02745 [Myxococcales bacterium]|nr:hypothetical protein [Myxococcales bacterium]
MLTRLALALALLPLACGGDAGDTDAPETSSATSDTGEPPTTGEPAEDPPTDEEALAAWLTAGAYRTWPAESGPHASTGPHFGSVRTYVNAALFDSLEAGSAVHPRGAAAVKELYGDVADVRGWSVMIKDFDNSTMVDDGDGWYWYESYNGSTFGDAFGDPTCTGCHAPTHPDFKDFFLTPFPLQ